MIKAHEIAALMRAVSTVTRDYYAWAIAPFVTRLDSIDAAVKAIPAGARGEKGDPGESITGPQGERGEQGQSIKGERGDKGDAGDIGPAGAQGDIGATGLSGVDGRPGDIGAVGLQGERGVDGVAGKDGAAGIDGKDADAELIFNQLRIELEQSVAALPKAVAGKDGAAGPQGLVGEKGLDGLPGKDGERGADGAPGIAGAIGEKGLAGERGIDGRDGRDGKDGATGRDAALIDPLEHIDAAKSYPRGTWAKHQRGLWLSRAPTDGMTGWDCIVCGISAIEITQEHDRVFSVKHMLSDGCEVSEVFMLPTMVYRDVWREGEFQRGDVVTWSGSAWHCQEATTEKPGDSTAWKLMVKHGSAGKDFRSAEELARASKDAVQRAVVRLK